jgi:uncharacterized RDD family membrane protein YckC
MTEPDWYRPPAAEIAAPADLAWTPEPSHTVGFWPRAAARFVDALVGIAASFAAGSLYAALPQAMTSAIPKVRFASLLTSALIGWVLTIVGNAAAEAFGGATVGKLVLGMRVKMVDGSRCTPGAAFKRSLAYVWDAFFFGMVAYGSMKKTDYNQRTGDRWADTLVVRASAIPNGLRLRDLAMIGAAVDVMFMFAWDFLTVVTQVNGDL